MRSVPLEPDAWRFSAAEHRFEEHLGRPSLYLHTGDALVAGAAFLDGTLEFDLAVPPERNFAGCTWRVVDERNCETFYVRPHQSGNPDATQYSPVFNGVSGWQLYHGERYTVPLEIPFDEWLHVRVDVLDEVAEITAGDVLLRVDGLKREPVSGAFGLMNSNLAGAWFSNVAWSDVAPTLRGTPRAPEPRDERAVAVWQVSEPFAEEELGDTVELDARAWTRLESEPSGLADLARVHGLDGDANTVLARATVRAPAAHAARLELGFSDRARVYLNGRALYAGDDSYRSRDYRFLGSIGWWDTVWLPLEQGENELVVAVSESFGGWGVQARFPSPDGLVLGG